MGDSNVGLALGTLAGQLGDAYAQKKQREHDDEIRKAKAAGSSEPT